MLEALYGDRVADLDPVGVDQLGQHRLRQTQPMVWSRRRDRCPTMAALLGGVTLLAAAAAELLR